MGEFKMRTTKPEAGNKYYITKSKGGWSDAIQGNPVDSDCNVLSNCVGYAYGRFNEIGGYGYCKWLRPINAENFYQVAKEQGLSVGSTPKLGAVICWQRGATLNGGDGAGHVAVVEKIVSNTEIMTSESGWGSKPFWTQTRKKGNGNWGQNSSYKFLGFIYNPAVSDSSTTTTVVTKPVSKPTTTTSPSGGNKIDTVEEVQVWLNNNYRTVIGEKLEEDGKYGALTKAALVKVLQKALGFVGKNVDGIYGNKTNNAIKTLQQGSYGEVVKVLQALLVCNGYSKAYVDGNYGSGTADAVESYQRARGLGVDRKAGKATFKSLCK